MGFATLYPSYGYGGFLFTHLRLCIFVLYACDDGCCSIIDHEWGKQDFTQMTDYRRCYITGGSYFFTVALTDRSRSLLVDHIDILRQSIRVVKNTHPFNIIAMVVLPDHLHAIWTLPENDADFSLRWRQIKSAFSRTIPASECVSASRQSKHERGIWQRRFWEHAIRDEEDMQRCADYVHYNPVKHGLTQFAEDWPYSSVHRYSAENVALNNEPAFKFIARK